MANFLLGVHFEVPEEESPILQPYQPLSLQLYSEYRSTYKWHEFTPNTSNSAGASVASTLASNNEVVVRKPPKPITGNFPFARKHFASLRNGGAAIHCWQISDTRRQQTRKVSWLRRCTFWPSLKT